MGIFQTLSGPVIGAVIGYFTNYIAVKMLFRPLNPVKIGKYTLPFTPGVIPKRKNEMAQAFGTTISNKLVTKEDLEKVLLSDGMKQSVTDGIVDYLLNKAETTITVKEVFNNCLDEKIYEDLKLQVETLIVDRVMASLQGVDLGAVIANEGGTALKEKVKGTMLAMLVNDKMIASIAEPIGAKVKEYVENNGAQKIQPVIRGEIESFENKTLNVIMERMPFHENQVKDLVGRIYNDCISGASDTIISQVDIVGIVKGKILDMDVNDMERLVLGVMEKELDTVVNLGAVLGFLIGLLNLIFK